MDLISNQIVFMISDLHVGDPKEPHLEDFNKDDDFQRLLADVIPERHAGPSTLVIAGDFIDFPQVLPGLGRHKMGKRFGATEQQSLAKMERVIVGHPKVFGALEDFVNKGNQVVVLPGNHDIDLHWPSVFERLREALGGAPPPKICFVKEGEIHEKRIHIEHGNQYSFDNWFEHWTDPIVDAPDGPRIERPWGTLFMDIVYNDIENLYPFVNKVYPHSVYAQIILRSIKDTENVSAKALGRLLLFFVLRGKRFIWEHLLGREEDFDEEKILSAEAIQSFLADLGAEGPVERLNEIALETFLMASLVDPSDLSSAKMDQYGLDAVDRGLLGRNDERGIKRRQKEFLESGEVDVLAFGHTHVAEDGNLAPMWGPLDPRRSFNTGSWMPHVQIGQLQKPYWKDLRSLPQTHEIQYLVIELEDHPRASLEKL